MVYPDAAWERAMTVQEVLLKALRGEIHWFRAADTLGFSPRTLRRWRERYEHPDREVLIERYELPSEHDSEARGDRNIRRGRPAATNGQRQVAQLTTPEQDAIASVDRPGRRSLFGDAADVSHRKAPGLRDGALPSHVQRRERWIRTSKHVPQSCLHFHGWLCAGCRGSTD
jgi:hypothetical protein